MVKYNETVRGIDSRQVTAWIVKTSNGKQHLLLWHKDATIEQVHESCKIFFEKFTLGAQDVGDFLLEKIEHGYMADARKVDQDWNVVL